MVVTQSYTFISSSANRETGGIFEEGRETEEAGTVRVPASRMGAVRRPGLWVGSAYVDFLHCRAGFHYIDTGLYRDYGAG